MALEEDKREQVLKELSKKNNISLAHLREIWFSQFKLVKETIIEGQRDCNGYLDKETFKNIKLPYFGKFGIKPGKIEFINKCRKRRLETFKKSNE